MFRTPSRKAPSQSWLLAGLAGATLLLGGCAEGIDTRYGESGGQGVASVNGTRVLADMFEAEGHSVSALDRLSPRLMKSDVIIWFPNDFDVPSREVRDWLDNWLFSGPDRTLIYIGRDFDSAPLYWKKITPRVAAGDQTLTQKRLAEAETEAQIDRKSVPATGDCEWFELSGKLDRREVRTLAGPWSEGIDPTKVEIELNGRLKPVDWAQALLESGDDVLVARHSNSDWDGSQLITVANGSFLLNLPLVNHEHRKLAGRLIATVGDKRRVTFLESKAGGPPIMDKEPSLPDSNSLALLGVWPLSGILLQLGIVGIIFCFARWSIFGRPVVPPAPSASDFGKHVTALGQLLARTKDRSYALARIAQWRERQNP